MVGSSLVELAPGGEHLRQREGWQRWIVQGQGQRGGFGGGGEGCAQGGREGGGMTGSLLLSQSLH